MMSENDIELEVYEEVIGEFVELREEDDDVKVILFLNGVKKELKYPSNCEEGRILKENLRSIKQGKKIGILRTDLANRPLCIANFET